MALKVSGTPKSPKNYWFYLFCILISFLFYGNTLKNGFSMDDELVTTTQKQSHPNIEKGIAGIKDIFTSRYAQDGKQSYAYRPVTTYSFAIEYDLFKDAENRAKVSHTISVLLYALCGILLFIFLQTLFKQEAWWFSALVVLIFLIHPLHSEVVNNIKSRDELLAFNFGLLMLINVLKYFDYKKIKNLLFGILSLFLCIFSKETGTIFVALIPVVLYFFRDINVKKLIFTIIVVGTAFFLFKKGFKIMLDKESVRYFQYFENPLYELDFSSRIPMFFYTILLYIVLLFKPFPLKYYYGYDEVSLVGYGNWEFYLSLAVFLTLFFFMLKGLKDKKLYSFIILFFFLAIGGAANLLFPLPGIIAERFAFVASTAFSIFIAWLIFNLYKTSITNKIKSQKSSYLWVFLILITGSSFIYSFNRNKAWESSMSIYSTDIVKLRNSMKANSLLATEYATSASIVLRSGNMDEFTNMMMLADSSLKYYESALNIYDKYANTHNNIGFVYFNLKNNVYKGLPYWREAIRLDENYQEAWFNYGSALGKIKRHYDELGVVLGHTPNLTFTPSSDSLIQQFQKINSEESLIKKFESWETLNHLENIYRKIWSGNNLNPSMAISFGNYFDNYLKHKNDLLRETGAGEYVKRIVKQPLNQQGQLLGQTMFKLRENLALKIKKELKSSNWSEEELIRTGSYLYRDSFYIVFDKLYEIDPNYSRQFNTVSQFASADENAQKLIEWGHRFVEAYPEDSGQGYMQIASAYQRMNNVDSATTYFSKALVFLESDLSDMKMEKNAQKQQIDKLTKDIQQLKNFLNSTEFKE